MLILTVSTPEVCLETPEQLSNCQVPPSSQVGLWDAECGVCGHTVSRPPAALGIKPQPFTTASAVRRGFCPLPISPGLLSAVSCSSARPLSAHTDPRALPGHCRVLASLSLHVLPVVPPNPPGALSCLQCLGHILLHPPLQGSPQTPGSGLSVTLWHFSLTNSFCFSS